MHKAMNEYLEQIREQLRLKDFHGFPNFVVADIRVEKHFEFKEIVKMFRNNLLYAKAWRNVCKFS